MRNLSRIAPVALAIGMLMATAPAVVGAQEPATAGPPTDYSQLQGLSQPIYTTSRQAFEVRGHDGINLYVEVVKPNNAPEGSRFPVVLEASPYHGTLADRDGTRILPDPKVGGNSIGLTGYFAPRGYAVAMMDLRGTGRSEGCLDHIGGNDAKDLKTVIEWLADQPWSNGRVGMAGHSYVGATQAVAAAQNPRGLVTIVPSAGLARMYDHQFQFGVPYFLQWAGPQWSYEGIAMARHLPAAATPATNLLFGASGDNFGNDMEYFGCGWPNSALTAGHGQATGQAQGWHAARDWEAGAAAWKGHIFMVHGVNDNAARIPAAEWFFKDRDPRPTDKVWLGQWDHGSNCCPNRRGMQWTFALHAWYDHHLMQRTWTDENGVEQPIDTGPPVEVFVNDNAAIQARQETYTADWWPGPQTTVELHAVAADNSLSTTVPAAGSKSYTAAAVSVGPVQNEQSGRFVEFTSAPLEQDMLLLGPPPDLTLAASITGQRLNMIATLYASNGATRRAINYCAINPELRNGIYTSSPIVPGQEMQLKPQCFTIGSIVRAGETLVLKIGGASPHHVSWWAADAQVTVYTGPGKTSIKLPAIPSPVLYTDVLEA